MPETNQGNGESAPKPKMRYCVFCGKNIEKFIVDRRRRRCPYCRKNIAKWLAP
jgi:hypothetical protein